jgi:hypothetical protein
VSHNYLLPLSDFSSSSKLFIFHPFSPNAVANRYLHTSTSNQHKIRCRASWISGVSIYITESTIPTRIRTHAEDVSKRPCMPVDTICTSTSTVSTNVGFLSLRLNPQMHESRCCFVAEIGVEDVCEAWAHDHNLYCCFLNHTHTWHATVVGRNCINWKAAMVLNSTSNLSMLT